MDKILKSSHGEIALTPEKLFSLDFKFVKEYDRYPEPKYQYDGRFDIKARVLRFKAVSGCGAVVKLDLDKPKSISDTGYVLFHPSCVYVLDFAEENHVEGGSNDDCYPFYKGVIGGESLTDEMIEIVKSAGFNEIVKSDDEYFYDDIVIDSLRYKLLMVYASYLISELINTQDLNSNYAKSTMDNFLCFMVPDGKDVFKLCQEPLVKEFDYKITIPSPVIEFLCYRIFCKEGGL